MPTYHKKTIEDIALDGKKALVRCDFNVPLSDGVITVICSRTERRSSSAPISAARRTARRKNFR